MDKGLARLADTIAKMLMAEGVIVQKYAACSTNSIYLKLDYGVCNSIRISDHPGKKHLKYRYNIGTFVEGYRKEKDKFDRFYYRADKYRNMVKKILDERTAKKAAYGEARYRAFMKKNREENRDACGFWREAVLLNG